MLTSIITFYHTFHLTQGFFSLERKRSVFSVELGVVWIRGGIMSEDREDNSSEGEVTSSREMSKLSAQYRNLRWYSNVMRT